MPDVTSAPQHEKPRRLPYPWTDDAGLAPVLRDPSLWSSALEDNTDRQLAKRCAKRLGIGAGTTPVHVVRVTDDNAIGQLLIDLLSTPKRRLAMTKQIQREAGMPLSAWLAPRLYRTISETGVPKLSDICKERADRKWYMIPSLFASWLASNARSLPDRRVLALYSAAFAILQPADAAEIAQVLIDHDPGLQDLLSDPPVVAVDERPAPATTTALRIIAA